MGLLMLWAKYFLLVILILYYVFPNLDESRWSLQKIWKWEGDQMAGKILRAETLFCFFNQILIILCLIHDCVVYMHCIYKNIISSTVHHHKEVSSFCHSPTTSFWASEARKQKIAKIYLGIEFNDNFKMPWKVMFLENWRIGNNSYRYTWVFIENHSYLNFLDGCSSN